MTQPIYETFVHMSQPFGMNVPEIDFHGNNGNVIVGDVPASDRYTEVRLSSIAEKYILDGVDKNAVDMIPNYLEDEEWPKYLPSVFPRLLVNGAQGIGVSLATYIPGHNLSDTVKLITDYLKTEELNDDDYYPDFPTGGTIINKSELTMINKTGKGRIILQAKYRIQKNKITFYEMPYQVYIEDTIDEIKKAIEDGKIQYVDDVYNNSDKSGIELVVVCSSAVKTNVVLEQLFDNTHLRNQYNANQNAIVSKTPVLLNLKQMVDTYVSFNLECIQREAQFDLEKIEQRLHIIEALLEAIDNIELVITTIRKDENPKEWLKGHFDWDDKQTDAILGMRLSKLSHLESDKLEQEKKDKEEKAQECRVIINNERYRRQILCNKLYKMDEEFGSKRRTEVIDMEMKTDSEKSKDMTEYTIEPVRYSDNSIAYIRKYTEKAYSSFIRGTNDDKLLLFSTKGKMYRINIGDVKVCGQTERGTVVSSLVTLGKDEKIIAVFPNKENDYKYFLFVTALGYALKSEKTNFIGTTKSIKGVAAYKFKKSNDSVRFVEQVNDSDVVDIIGEPHEDAYGDVYNKKVTLEIKLESSHGRNTSGRRVIIQKEPDVVYDVAVQ